MTSTVSAQSRLESFDKVRKTLEIVKKNVPGGVPVFATMSPLGDFAESAVVLAKKAKVERYWGKICRGL